MNEQERPDPIALVEATLKDFREMGAGTEVAGWAAAKLAVLLPRLRTSWIALQQENAMLRLRMEMPQ